MGSSSFILPTLKSSPSGKSFDKDNKDENLLEDISKVSNLVKKV